MDNYIDKLDLEIDTFFQERLSKKIEKLRKEGYHESYIEGYKEGYIEGYIEEFIKVFIRIGYTNSEIIEKDSDNFPIITNEFIDNIRNNI
ncbi:MAG: hypothetical protein R3Y29_05005 [bacterium]